VSLHQVTKKPDDPDLRDLATFFDHRWGDQYRTYEVTGATITEWGRNSARAIEAEVIEHWRTSAEFTAWRRRRR